MFVPGGPYRPGGPGSSTLPSSPGKPGRPGWPCGPRGPGEPVRIHRYTQKSSNKHSYIGNKSMLIEGIKSSVKLQKLIIIVD